MTKTKGKWIGKNSDQHLLTGTTTKKHQTTSNLLPMARFPSD